MATAGGGDAGYDRDIPPRKEIYTYQAPWTVFAMAWSRRYVFVAPFECISSVEFNLTTFSSPTALILGRSSD